MNLQKPAGSPHKLSRELRDPQQDESSFGPLGEVEVAQYVADLSLQLRNTAKKANLTFLAYLLEMVFEEALMTSRKDTNAKIRASQR